MLTFGEIEERKRTLARTDPTKWQKRTPLDRSNEIKQLNDEFTLSKRDYEEFGRRRAIKIVMVITFQINHQKNIND